MNKKSYSPPALRSLTREQAKKLIADSKSCSEEEGGHFLESFRQRQHDQKQNGPMKEAKAKPSARVDRLSENTQAKSRVEHRFGRDSCV